MPLYEYQCESCSHRFERIQKFSDPLYTHCPKCGGDVRKLISSAAIQFKGSGFYKTDYANKPAETKSESKGESKTETKSDGKSSSTEKTG